MRKAALIALGFMLAWSSASCSPAEDAPALSLAPITGVPSSGCPAAVGEGTVAPAIAIQSVTLLADDAKLTLSDGDTLTASLGSRVRVVEIALCVGSFSGDAGDACADFAPIGESGDRIGAEHAGTHLIPLTPGTITVPGPDHTWTIEDGWTAIAAVVNHWPGVKTEDHGCAEANCERDDWLILPLP